MLKQPGDDAEAHLRVTQKVLEQAREIERLRALLLEARDAQWDAYRTHGHWLLDVDRALRGEGE